VEDGATLVNVQVPLASISQYTSAYTHDLKQELAVLTEKNDRLEGLAEEHDRLVSAYEEERLRMKKDIERLERDNKEMKERLDTISRALRGY